MIDRDLGYLGNKKNSEFWEQGVYQASVRCLIGVLEVSNRCLLRV